jgi:hypothetical protein
VGEYSGISYPDLFVERGCSLDGCGHLPCLRLLAQAFVAYSTVALHGLSELEDLKSNIISAVRRSRLWQTKLEEKANVSHLLFRGFPVMFRHGTVMILIRNIRL